MDKESVAGGVRWPLVESVRAGVDALTGTASVAQTAEAA
jgi:hypothetical protein